MIQSTYELFDVPEHRRGVPTMIIGSRVLVGGLEIPQWAPILIREGLEGDGVDLPPIPGLQEAYRSALAQSEPGHDESHTAEAQDTFGEEAANVLASHVARDPLANALSIGVLLGLCGSIAAVVISGLQGILARDRRPLTWLVEQSGWRAKVAIATAGLVLAMTLVVQPADSPYAAPLAMSMAASLAVVVAMLWASAAKGITHEEAWTVPGWLIALAGLAGLADAIYMAYVEVAGTEAFCGTVGDCNSVQQSSYAILFGVIPVGVLGVAGYAAIFVTLIVIQEGNGYLSDLAQIALLGMTLFGTVFSTYLTFLEPFVIGATCVWCLTSAVLMMLTLWLAAPPGWAALPRVLNGAKQAASLSDPTR